MSRAVRGWYCLAALWLAVYVLFSVEESLKLVEGSEKGGDIMLGFFSAGARAEGWYRSLLRSRQASCNSPQLTSVQLTIVLGEFHGEGGSPSPKP